MKKVTILGAGAFGYAMAKIVAENHSEKKVFLYDIQKDCISHIQEKRQHPFFHPGVKIPDNIFATTNCSESIKDADLIILAIPSQFLRSAASEFKKTFNKKASSTKSC